MSVKRWGAILVVAGLAILSVGASSAAAETAKEPAWELVGVTGPTHLPPTQSEVQRVTVGAEGGTFTLQAPSGEGAGTPVIVKGNLTYTAGSTMATVVGVESGKEFEVGARITGSRIPTETTILSCTPDCKTPGSTVELSNAPAASKTGQAVEVFTHELSGVSGTFVVGDEITGAVTFPIKGEVLPTGTRVTAVGAETLTLSEPTNARYSALSGSVALSATETTGPIAFNATAANVEAAIAGLPAFGPGSVHVSGGPGGDSGNPYLVSFGGKLAYRDVAALVPNGSALAPATGYVRVFTTVPGGAGTGFVGIFPTNLGGSASHGDIKVVVRDLPSGLAVAGEAKGSGWTCTPAAGGIECTTQKVAAPLEPAKPIKIPVEVQAPFAYASQAVATISGGGAKTVSTVVPIVVSPEAAASGIASFWAGAYEANGEPSTQAGGHPYSALTEFHLNTVRAGSGEVVPAGDPRDVNVDLPPGFAGDPLLTERCPQSLLAPAREGQEACDRFNSVIGRLGANTEFAFGIAEAFPIYNDVPVFGSAVEFTSKLVKPEQNLLGSVRADEDFGVQISAPNTASLYEKVFDAFAVIEGRPESAGGRAFLQNPTDCAQQAQEQSEGRGPATHVSISTWQESTNFAHIEDPLPLLTGCQALTESWLGHGPEPKKPSFSFQPTVTQGSSGTGATASLHISQEGLTDPNKLATAHLRKAEVTLPAGLTLNPSSASGLEACSESQIGYLGSGFASPNPIRFDESTPQCPDGSKLGTVEATSPLLEEPLSGTIYLAAQDENPFHSLVALYLVIESPRFGLNIKLPGEVALNPDDGQLSATFDNNPQLPVEDLTLHFRGGGPRSELATPEVCGHYATTGALTPWSAEHGESAGVAEGGFDVSGACAGSAGGRHFSPSFEAGTIDPLAGAYSPLVIKINRNDGEQELSSLDFTLPPGLTGRLAGVPYCPDSAIAAAGGRTGKQELAGPSCPAATQIGTVDTSAGVGSQPFHVSGNVYLSGPYRGAPISAVVITPAVAGPFDLGNVVIRSPLYVDPETARISAKSDPIPTILKGVPLKLRSVAISIDRSGFSLNPTNCEAMSVSATLGSSSGATTSPSNRFQVGSCDKLKFKPRLKIRLKGATRRGGLPALKAVVTYPKKGAYANIARAQVNLPHSEFLEQSNLNKTCTRPVLLEGKCPKATIYGKAKAWTPLLEKPLQGPVYLVGGYGYKLPALVAELNGQIRVVLKGKVDSGKNKGIRNTFEAVPDAPVSRFVLEMKGGKKYGLLINSENLCRKKQVANARFVAQNGLVEKLHPRIANSCKSKKKAKHHRAKHGRRAGGDKGKRHKD